MSLIRSPIFIPNENYMKYFGIFLSRNLKPGDLVFLKGDLGSGKTTVFRGFLRSLGIDSRIKSPTFGLIEEYFLGKVHIYHFDLYRVDDPKELSKIGILDYFRENTVCFVEWPEKFEKFLPQPTKSYKITIPENHLGRLIYSL